MLQTVEAIEVPPQNAQAVNTFSGVDLALRTSFYKPDHQAIRIVLGTLQAHYLKIGDPAWLFVIAPPGAGKTTLSIMGACGLPEVTALGDFTEQTFLSGFYGSKQAGLLEKLGRTVQEGKTYVTEGDAIFLLKDFTTVLSMRREKRGVILSQLREIHDGMFKRDFGTGETKIWRGRVSIIAAVTPAIDRYNSIFTVLGERFLKLRWHRPDSEEAGEWAIRQQGREKEIQGEIKGEVERIFKDASCDPPMLSGAMTRRIAALAEIVAIARTHVFRNSYGNREIEFIPEPEANTRIAKGLAAIARGVASLNRRPQVEEADLQDSFRVGLDCISEIRRNLVVAASQNEPIENLRLARTTREREVEDLSELGVLQLKNGLQLSDRIQRLLLQSGARIG